MYKRQQQNHANENLPAQQPQQQERKVIEREKPYEFDDILNGVDVLEIMQDGYGFLRSSDYNYPVSYTHLTINFTLSVNRSTP